MRLRFKPLSTVLITIILFVGGFFFLLRGCLSKYDERSALAPVLYFEKDGKDIIFTIVKFEKATSYSRKGGFVSKSVSTRYFIQTNDAVTGKKISSKKIKHNSDIKYHPVQIMGASGNTAWMFMGELMAFDPFTLDKIADKDIIEEKNPSVKGKLPAEERYYSFNHADKNVYITATDGSTLKLDTKTGLVTETDSDPSLSVEENEIKQIEKQLKQNQANQDSLYQQKNYRPSRLLSNRDIDRNEYNRLTKGYYEDRSQLNKIRDSLQALKSKAEKQQRSGDDLRRRIESLVNNSSTGFSQVKTNQDTLNGKWYGLYTEPEMEKVYNRVQHESAYGETARRKLFIAGFTPDTYGDFIIDKENAMVISTGPFLDGGLLLNKLTALPVQLQDPASFLVVFKNQVGNDGFVQISRVATDGKKLWTFDSQLKSWADWVVTPKYLFLLGVNNKELSSSNYNILWSINLADGTAAKHDYFADK
jgi:hypothetical protein